MMSKSVDTLIRVELVGGPCDGEYYRVAPGQLFMYVERGEGEYIYGLGDDGKYHYCPDIHEESGDE